MENSYRYMLPVCANDKMGLLFKVAIKEKVTPNICYAGKELPRSYFVRWENEKVWDAYQVHYVTEGSGVYEDISGKYPIRAGSLVITQPGVWHRYLPSSDQGWEENYLGFTWPLVEKVLDQVLLSHKKPVIDIGIKEELLETYHQIFESVAREDAEIDHYISGMVLKLLGVILSTSEQVDTSSQRIENVIQQTCFFIKRNVDKNIDFKEIASENNLGYEHFRKLFRQLIGMPPGQYHLYEKIKAAKGILMSTDKSVKEISYELGFESVYYFCRLFKKKMGVTPSQARERCVAL
jgi:AraC-like DNA-binding protein